MKTYAIYTQKEIYPVIEDNGIFYITRRNTGTFSGQWKLIGFVEKTKGIRNIINPNQALNITDWLYKNGNSKYQVIDEDHGSTRRWAGTDLSSQIRSFSEVTEDIFDRIIGGKDIKLESKEDFIVNVDPDKLDKYRKEHPICEYCGKELSQEEIKACHINSVGNGICFDCKYNDMINESVNRPKIGKLVLLYNNNSRKEINVEDIVNQDLTNVTGILDWCNLIMDPEDYKRLSSENPNASYMDLVSINLNEGKTSIPSEFLKRDYEKLKNDPMIGAKEHWSDAYYNEVEEYGRELKEDKCIICGSTDLDGCYSLKGQKVCRDCGKTKTSKEIFDKVDKLLKENEDPTRFGTYKIGDIVQIEDTYTHKYFGKFKVIRELSDEERNLKYGSSVIGYELETLEPEEFKGQRITSNNYRMKSFEDLNEECSQASGVASGVNGKIDNFPINPKKMEKQRLKENKEDLKVKNYTIENTGGNTLVIMGQLENGNYFGLGDEWLVIFDDNYHQAYLDGLTGGETDWEEEHTIDSYYMDEDEFKIIKDQIKNKTLNESENNIFDAREELINYLNQTTDYEWDANESYDNCAITELEDDYIEVFVNIENGKKIYTVDNQNYNSLEDLVKNIPNLSVDEDYEEIADDWGEVDKEWLDDAVNQLKTINTKYDGKTDSVPSYEDLVKAGVFGKKKEAKDLTETLQEISLLEDYKDEDNISPQKQKFIEYCKDRIIEDMGTLEIDEEDYTIIMHTEGIREFEDLRIIADFEDPDFDVLMAIDKNNKVVINSRMIDANGYVATMEFDQIDKAYYDMILKYWDDIYMDEMIDEE